MNTQKESAYSTLELANIEVFAQVLEMPAATKYVRFNGICYDKYGNRTGSFIGCYSNGYVDCIKKNC